jgi:hypothetical protein
MAGTVATLYPIGNRNAVLLDPYCMTNLDRGLLVLINRFDGTCRTNLRATITFRATISMFVRHSGLHKMHQIATWTKNLVRTLGYTELTTRATSREVLE